MQRPQGRTCQTHQGRANNRDDLRWLGQTTWGLWAWDFVLKVMTNREWGSGPLSASLGRVVTLATRHRV